MQTLGSFSVLLCKTLSFRGIAEGQSTCYKLNSTAEVERKYQANSLHGTIQRVCFPSGMHAHCNQHRSVHCVSRAQPLIWTAIWRSGFQLYIRGTLCPLPASRAATWFKADGLRLEQQQPQWRLVECERSSVSDSSGEYLTWWNTWQLRETSTV